MIFAANHLSGNSKPNSKNTATITVKKLSSLKQCLRTTSHNNNSKHFITKIYNSKNFKN